MKDVGTFKVRDFKETHGASRNRVSVR